MVRMAAVPAAIWVGSTWASIWTAILIVALLAAMCLGRAAENWGREHGED